MELDYTGGRQTGRTSRMIKEIIKSADMGFAVYVLCASSGHAQQLAKAFPNLVEKGVKFEDGNLVPEFNPFTQSLRRSWPNCRVFVDHNFAEIKAQEAAHAYTAWDTLARKFDQETD